MKPETPDFGLLEGVVAPRVLDAARAASKKLAELGVRHALAGGLAVGAHGWPRATRDVDFLVGEEAFEHHGGGLVTMKYGVPVEVGGVTVDLLSAKEGEDFLAREVDAPAITESMPVIGVEALVYMKLRASRHRDKGDLTDLIRSGLDVDSVERWLGIHAPELLEPFSRLVEDAERGR